MCFEISQNANEIGLAEKNRYFMLTFTIATPTIVTNANNATCVINLFINAYTFSYTSAAKSVIALAQLKEFMFTCRLSLW